MGKHKESLNILLLVLLSICVVFVDVYSYRVYREKLIRSEQKQLLAMAETIGESLNNTIISELTKIDYFFSGSETPSAKQLESSVREYQEKNSSVFDSITISEGTEPGDAVISGKHLSGSGWYVLEINKDVETVDGIFRLMFLMDLNEIYRRIVAPVKIGNGGYSVVKDKNLAIIMHHAKNQIGMDAIYDRKEQYPELDLSSLEDWLNLQRNNDKGMSVIDTFVWDDPDIAPIKRIVAFTTVDILEERWIVNSTLPMNELDEPLSDMLAVILTLTGVYFFIVAAVVILINRTRMRSESQKNEIRYLREINQGMEEVARQKDELRHYQRIESLGMMASHIAHEFNNYLTPVMVYAELLENDPETGERGKKMAGEILQSTDRAASLSRELLDFSRQDSGADLGPVNLRTDTEAAVEVIKRLTPKKIEFSSEIMSQDMTVLARDGMMQHILMNLCKNAFQAMEKSERKELKILLKRTEEGAVLTVSDTGMGIPKDAKNRIFEPFYTTKGSHHGTGLGLSVVRNIMHSLGGSISVESEQGVGTVFTLFFPEMSRSDEKKVEGIRKLIYVDNDKHFLDELEQEVKLRTRNSEVLQKSMEISFTAEEMQLLSRLQKDPKCCDILVVSYTLDSMNGIEFLEIVRRLNPDICLILASGSDDADLQWYVNNRIIDRIIMKDKLLSELDKLS
ncbi:histidine kinase [Lachnospiraceae bacterium JC7]|nr:histidine kinase [Lachnospiraceae bacterium JC7]